MTDPVKLSLPHSFHFNQVLPNLRRLGAAESDPPLGALAALAGVVFKGPGFNTIFRPQNAASPTPLPTPVPGSDNILELNLTQESLAFSAALGSVPNRGFAQQDLFMNGIPYAQTVSDVTFPGQSPVIHFEPGLWIAVPTTQDPAISTVTYMRMGSIPHGVTILAQGTATGPAPGAPKIGPANINPFPIGGKQPPIGEHPFQSQVAAAQNTARIPQDLTSYIAAGTITQAILDDPNTILRNHLAGQTVVSTTTLSITTQPAQPLFGGGTHNMAFLLGSAANPPPNPNANAFLMTATFWIETVQEQIQVPAFRPGQPPLMIRGAPRPGAPTPVFSVKPPMELTQPRTVTATFTQLQYSQTVFLNFNTLTWPHVSVATMIGDGPIEVPASAFG